MKEMLTLTTRMNALTRIVLGNVNIAATTALQVCCWRWCVGGLGASCRVGWGGGAGGPARAPLLAGLFSHTMLPPTRPRTLPSLPLPRQSTRWGASWRCGGGPTS